MTVLVLALALPLVGGPTRPAAGQGSDRHHQIAPGVDYTELRRPGLVAHVARVAAGSGFDLRPVLADDRVAAGSRQATSELCRRAGGVVCVNADFASCPACRAPYGGVVVDGRVLRTPHHAHHQVTFTPEGPTSLPLVWGGQLVAEHVWRAPIEGPLLGGPDGSGMELRRERRVVPLAGLNVAPVGGGAVLYTPDWGPATPTPAGHLEVVLATAAPVAPGVVDADVGGQRDGGGPVPNGGVVVSANGDAARALQVLADEWRRSDATEKTLVVETALTLPARHSVGGHPVLLRDGERQEWWRGDAKAIGRHPRTLLGWTPAGDLVVVVVDGRSPGHSGGLTLDESADLLVSLGASDGINLDGGGSSTFIGPCPSGPCVLNRPSDGRERVIPVALALVGDRSAVTAIAPQAAPPLGPPGPPPEDDPASTAHVEPPPPEEHDDAPAPSSEEAEPEGPEAAGVPVEDDPQAGPTTGSLAAADDEVTLDWRTDGDRPLVADGHASAQVAAAAPSGSGSDAGSGRQPGGPVTGVAVVLAAGVAAGGVAVRRQMVLPSA